MKKTFLIKESDIFIGYHLAKHLLQKNYTVYGIDNLNDYCSKKFKYTNIEQGIEKFVLWYKKYNNI